MLVLTRRLLEGISLNHGQFLVKIVQIKGKKVRLGIVCDKKFQIDRIDEDEVIEYPEDSPKRKAKQKEL